jgi:hypothetical protein
MTSPMRSTAPPMRLGSTVLLEDGLAADLRPKAVDDFLNRGRINRRSGGQTHGNAVSQLIEHRVRLAVDGAKTIEPSVPSDDLEEVDQRGRRTAAKGFFEDLRFFLGQNEDGIQNGFQLRKSVDHLGEDGVELLGHRCGLSGPLGRIEQGLGVNVGDVFDAHVGLKLGRDAGVFGVDVLRFSHDCHSASFARIR